MPSGRTVVVFAIGDAYQRVWKVRRPVFSEYAKRCGADLQVVDRALDPLGHRKIVAQKLLIPSRFAQYEQVLFLDIDMILKPSLPNVFELVPKECGLAAVLDPRGTDLYMRTWAAFPDVLTETTESYFGRRGFPPSPRLQGSINGGVLYFRPALVGEAFRSYYEGSDQQLGYGDGNEESPMAYLSQTSECFYPLPNSFNAQVHYYIYGTDAGQALLERKKRRRTHWELRIRSRRLQWRVAEDWSRTELKQFIREQMKDQHIVHLAGGFPQDLTL